MQNERIRFDNGRGQTLAGVLDRPPGEPRAYALFAHCFTCSKNLRAAAHISQALTDAGIAVLRFDFTGLGQSEGEFADTNFSSNVDDLVAAAGYLAVEHGGPGLLVGHSLGGTAVLQAAARIESAVAVVTIASPAEPAHVARMFDPAGDELERDGQAQVRLGGREFTIRQQFVDDLAKHDLPASIGALGKALLVMHAPLDDLVSIDNASALFVAAKHPKSFVSLDKADHLLGREIDSRYAGRVIAAWASRYLPTAAESQVTPRDASWIVARTGARGFYTAVSAAGHALVADEPADVGGSGRGPSPYDLLSAALASCTTMTLRMYANHKKLDVVAITARVKHRRVHADDCSDCESTAGHIGEFQRELSIDGKLTDAERRRMLEIADKCPVHRTLHSEVKVRSRLAE